MSARRMLILTITWTLAWLTLSIASMVAFHFWNRFLLEYTRSPPPEIIGAPWVGPLLASVPGVLAAAVVLGLRYIMGKRQRSYPNRGTWILPTVIVGYAVWMLPATVKAFPYHLGPIMETVSWTIRPGIALSAYCSTILWVRIALWPGPLEETAETRQRT